MKSKNCRIILILFVSIVANHHLLYCTVIYWRMDVYCTFMTHVMLCNVVYPYFRVLYLQAVFTSIHSISADTFHVLSTHIL